MLENYVLQSGRSIFRLHVKIWFVFLRAVKAGKGDICPVTCQCETLEVAQLSDRKGDVSKEVLDSKYYWVANVRVMDTVSSVGS